LQVAGATAALALGAAEPDAAADAAALGAAALAGGAESPEPLAHPLTTIATIAKPLSQRPIL
jgi:hypothetical protein